MSTPTLHPTPPPAGHVPGAPAHFSAPPTWGPPVPDPGNGRAVAGFVLGLASLLLLLISIGILSPLTLGLGIGGAILGLVGKRRVDRGTTASGRGLGIAGVALGSTAAVFSLLAIALFTVGFLSGGAGDSPDIPGAEATVQAYLGALVDGEGDGACELLEAGARRQLASGPGSRQFGTVGSCEDFVEAQAAAIEQYPGGSIVYDGARMTPGDTDEPELRTSLDLTRGLATVRGPDGREPIQLRYDEDEGWRIIALPAA